jgi:lipopolysaccharide/colanic/teichoic acid biosynthesis glycosyltransferase
VARKSKGSQAREAAIIGGPLPASALFWFVKRGVDIGLALALLPVFILITLVLIAINPRWNPGSVFFVQPRMGRGCRPFPAFKFRTMRTTGQRPRGPDAPLETDRIPALGNALRRTRIDEIPQIINILRGEMSFIGPRPDFFGHARAYLRAIPEYRDRHRVRPGLSGLAQVEQGYAEGLEATRTKAQLDLEYIQNAGFAMDWRLLWRTFAVILGGKGR